MFITKEAKKLFIEYVVNHELAFKLEQECSGLNDIISNLNAHFALQFNKGAYPNISELIRENGDMFDENIMIMWIEANYKKVYLNKNYNC